VAASTSQGQPSSGQSALPHRILYAGTSARVNHVPFPHLLISSSHHRLSSISPPHRPHRHHFASATAYRRRFRPGSGINRLQGSTTNVAFVRESLSLTRVHEVRLYIATVLGASTRVPRHPFRHSSVVGRAFARPIFKRSSGPFGQPEPQQQSTGSGACIGTATSKGLLRFGVSRLGKLSNNRWYA
jgi:hypothetical protein